MVTNKVLKNMFFILSKVLLFLISPIVWIIGLLLFSLFTKKRRWKKRAFVISLAMLLFFSNSFILDEFMRMWEINASRYETLNKTYDYGIILGGMITYDGDYERLGFQRSVDRIMQAIELYKLKKIKKIFICGGSGSIVNYEFKEGEILKNYLVTIGIPEEDILMESKSRNTRENAIYAAEVLQNQGEDASYLLITSAYHMRRSIGCFNKVGIYADPYATDRYSGQRKYIIDHLFVPNVEAIVTWNLLIHEVVGYVVYYAVGYI